jgi:hypothetical protein
VLKGICFCRAETYKNRSYRVNQKQESFGLPFLTDNALGQRKQKFKRMELGKTLFFLRLQNSKSYYGALNNFFVNLDGDNLLLYNSRTNNLVKIEKIFILTM